MTLNEATLEKRLDQVSNSQESIQTLSYFCLHYKNHHKRIVQIWLKCLQKAKTSHRLTLIHLANDIVQNAKRKNVASFIQDFKNIMRDTVPHLKDPKIKTSVERVFSIWQDRNIFDATFISELKGQLNGSSRSTTALATTNTTATTTTTSTATTTNSSSLASTHQLNDCLDKLAQIEKTIKYLNHGKVVSNVSDGGLPSDVKSYVLQLESEIEERTKLSGLLEDYLSKQKKLLKDAEDELIQFKCKLELVSK